MAAGLTEFVRYLGHSTFAIKSIVTGEKGAQEAHFDAIRIGRAEDYITLRNGKRQLWINLQKVKSEAGNYISFSDVESYRNIYIDLDATKPQKMKNFAATEEERAAALATLPQLEAWLESRGLRLGVELFTGNGCGMVLPIPETASEPMFIAKVATFLNVIKSDIPNVDADMFDPPRVIGIPGTINVKLETDDRKNQMRRVIGEIPERVEDPALLDFINSCEPDAKTLREYNKKYEKTAKEDRPQDKINADPMAVDVDAVIRKLDALRSVHLSLSRRLDGKIDEFENDRSRAEYSVCGSLVNAGFTDTEIDYILTHVSKIGKWQEEGDHYRFDMTLRKLRESEAANAMGPTVLAAFQALIDHEDQIKGECVWEWRLQKQRIQTAIKTGYLSQKGEEKAHKFLKQFKGILGDLGIDYDNLYPLLLKPKDNKEEFSDEIKAKAREVLKNEDPVQYVADSCGRLVLGAEAAFKKLISCVSVQNIRQSSGLHPKLTGNSSGGKTWTVYSFAHHLPHEMVVKGSMSAKAGFYHSDGDRVLRILDDYQAGNEDLDTVIKQTTSEFHEPYTHRTVVKQQAATLKIGSEQTWAITSVNNDQDIQVLNRAIPINVDDSVDLTKKVNNRTVERYGMGEAAKPVDEAVLVCRAMFQILRDEGYINVRVPFWERIEWLDTSNRRNPSIFMDLVIAHAAMFRYQREKDPEGYYLATEEDFQAAKSLFADKDGEELVKRLTRREREVLELLVGSPSGITRADVSERLDIAPQQVSRIFNGRNGEGGLLQKIAIREEEISDSTRINDTDYRAVKKILYSLKEYDRFAGLEGIVKLKPQKGDENTHPPDKTDGGRSGNHEETNEETIQTASSGNRETKETINKNKNKNKDKETVSSSPVDGETILSHAGEKNGFLGFHKAADSESDGFLNGSSSGSSGHEETIFCVTCGEDLTGKGTVTKNGLSYCARPGCGYPPRGEA